MDFEKIDKSFPFAWMNEENTAIQMMDKLHHPHHLLSLAMSA